MSKYRYPGAQPFSIEQKDIFFGREKDISDLFDLISLQNLVVLHSKSGLGKSSLLNAGIIPLIQQENKYLPISIRFGAFSETQTASPIKITQDRIGLIEKETFYLQKLIPDENSLWYYMKNQQLHKAEKKGFLLVFDQFEELFTYPQRAVNEFAKQVAALISSQIPNRFRKVLEQQYAQDSSTLSPKEQDLLHRPFDLKIVIAIRSDRMSLIDGLKNYLPNILRFCYKLDALNELQAEEAILNPAYKKGSHFLTPPFDYQDEVLDAILDFLTKKHTQKIESFQLQILCQHIELKVIKNQLKVVELNDVGNIETIYKNYYQHQIERLDSEEEKLAARKLIEEGLIFEAEERRLSLYEGQIHSAYQVDNELLRKLVDSHLLRREASMRGGYTYELSHDTLVVPVLKAKEKRVKEEKQNALKKAEQERLKSLQEARKKVAAESQRAENEKLLRIQAEKSEKRARQMTRWAVIVTCLTLLTSFTTLFYRQRGKIHEKETETMKAQKNKMEFEQLLQEADIYMNAEKIERACAKWRAAAQIDSTDALIRNRIKFCEETLK